MIVHSLLQAFFLSLLSFAASQEMLDLNPDLGPFQDDRECFPFTKSWRLIYRDFEEDPFMGGKSKCVKAVETGEFVDDGTLVIFEYPPDGIINTTFKLMSSPGYTAKNVLNVQPVDQPGTSINLTISFRDCHSCKVIRHSYINEGKGCSLWVTEDEMDLPHPCCSFVFELLCGFNPTYQIYDESCH